MSSERAMIRAEEPTFLRFITHGDHLLQAKLDIPRRFVQEYGSALSGSVLIKVPSGMTWKVALVKKNGGDILFGKGWEEFVLFHRLAYGHSMVFQYEGGCSFRVSIFNMTSTEINYPRSSTNTAGEEDLNGKSITEETKVKEEEEDACPELVDEVPQSLRKERGGPMRCLGQQKRTNIKAGVDPTLPKAKVEVYADQSGEECMSSNCQTRSGQTRAGKRKKTLTRKEKADALERAAGFKSDKPFFKIVLQPAYIRNCFLEIQYSFSGIHLVKQCASAILSCPCGKNWPVGFFHNKKHTRITSGWKKFVNDHGLKVGDVCVFELIEDTEISFKVAFFRAAEDAQLS